MLQHPAGKAVVVVTLHFQFVFSKIRTKCDCQLLGFFVVAQGFFRQNGSPQTAVLAVPQQKPPGHGLGFAAFSGKAPETMIRELMVLNHTDSFQRYMLAVYAGIQLAAAILPKKAVHGKQHASGVGTGKNTAGGSCIHMNHIVIVGILSFKGDSEVLQ